MVEELYSRAVIPTNSLFLIGEITTGKINDLIYYLKGSASSQEASTKLKPHRWLTSYHRTTHNCHVLFNRDVSYERFEIEDVVEAARSDGFGDIWVHEMRIRLKYRSTPFDFIFTNAPLTKGTDAERFVVRYMSNLQRSGFITKIQARHLPLDAALSYPRGAHISPDDMTDPSFIRWLSIKTNGVVMLKVVRRVDDTTFVDVRIKDGREA